jgi:hypothetical protein
VEKAVNEDAFLLKWEAALSRQTRVMSPLTKKITKEKTLSCEREQDVILPANSSEFAWAAN